MSTVASTTLAASLTSLAMVTPSLTTTFMPTGTATTCLDQRLTMLENRQWEIWMNMPLPVPGTTFTECYPSQYITSYLLSAGGVTQPAFQPLVCPQSYSAVGPYTSNYIACCPKSYSFHQPDVTAFSDRPAFGGTCYSTLYEATPVRVTAYGNASVTATSLWTASNTLAQAFAYPIEGYASGVAQIASVSASATSTTSGSATATGSAAKTTYTVIADTASAPYYTPSTVTASIGDSIIFVFAAGNHSVTQSTFGNPCERLSGGFDSGFEPNLNNVDPSPNYTISVTSSGSQWFYSKQSDDCTLGMVFALNPSTTQTYASFHAAAIASGDSNSTSSLSGGAKAGAAIGSIAGVALIFAALFFLYRRRKNAASTTNKSLEEGTDHESSPSMANVTHAGNEIRGVSHEGWGAGSEEVVPKPIVPPKGAELHDVSTPGELHDNVIPVEMGSEGYAYGDGYKHVQNGPPPVEMWSPSEHEGAPMYERDVKNGYGSHVDPALR